MLTKTGEIRHIQFTMSPLTENKVITSLLGSMEDITELVVAEEHLAREREKVEFSNRMATVGTMAGGIAHEINNPVTIINVHAMNIKRHIGMAPPNHEKAIEAAVQIQNMCKRIVKIIQGLKAFARQDGGSERPESKLLTEVLDESLLLAQDSLTREKVTLQLDVPKDLKILCRPVQIGQVLLNLVGNAIDAMSTQDSSTSDPTKWIKISAFAANEKMVHIHVDDSGPGVPKEIQSKIMDPFFTTKDPSKGTGLGLCISFEIMKSHGGDLHLDPNYPPTRFVMTLPVG